MSDNKVKGSVLLDFVRVVRANMSLPWDRYLTKEDMELVKAKIMPSSWYPFDAFERIGYAVFVLVGRENPRVAWNFGEFSMQETFHRVYETVLFNGKDPVEVLKRFVTLRKQFVKYEDPDFEALEMKKLADNRVRMTVRAPRAGPYVEPYIQHFGGAVSKLLDLTGTKGAEVRIIKVQSEKEPGSEVEVSWAPLK